MLIQSDEFQDIVECCLEWLDDFVKSNMKCFHQKDYEEEWDEYIRQILEEYYNENSIDTYLQEDNIVDAIVEHTIQQYYYMMPPPLKRESPIDNLCRTTNNPFFCKE